MSLILGPHRLDALELGTFALDGGAMFGIVPKPLWERKIPADERNRITQALRTLLIRTGDRVVLVDTGIGEKWGAKERDIYRLQETDGALDRELARLGLTRADVTDVVLTHLHFDHAGGATVRGAAGQEEPAFPNATVHLQRRNWEWASQPTEKDAGSYRPENFEALERSGRLRLVDGETELFPGVQVIPSDGHTVGMQLVKVSGDGDWLVYCADLIPTTAHLRTSWVMAYDLQPLLSMEEKKVLVAQAIDDGGMLFFEHDPVVQACRVREDDGKRVVAEEVRLS